MNSAYSPYPNYATLLVTNVPLAVSRKPFSDSGSSSITIRPIVRCSRHVRFGKSKIAPRVRGKSELLWRCGSYWHRNSQQGVAMPYLTAIHALSGLSLRLAFQRPQGKMTLRPRWLATRLVGLNPFLGIVDDLIQVCLRLPPCFKGLAPI